MLIPFRDRFYLAHHTRLDQHLQLCLADGWMVLLHGFIKKTQKTPAADLQLAAKRMKETQR